MSSDLITFQCPHCQRRLKAKAKARGQRLTCPNLDCGQSIIVPTEEPRIMLPESHPEQSKDALFNLNFPCPCCQGSITYTTHKAGTNAKCHACGATVHLPKLQGASGLAIEAGERRDWDRCVQLLRQAIASENNEGQTPLVKFLAFSLFNRARDSAVAAVGHAGETVQRRLAERLGVPVSPEMFIRLIHQPGGANVRLDRYGTVEEAVCGRCPLCGHRWRFWRKPTWADLPDGGRITLCKKCRTELVHSQQTRSLLLRAQQDLEELLKLNPSDTEARDALAEIRKILVGA